MRSAAVMVVLMSGALWAACLPEPEPAATIQVAIRGATGPDGTATFTSDDGYVLRFDRRIMVVGVGTMKQSAYGFAGVRASVRNLDARPTNAPDMAAFGDRAIEVAGAYYQSEYPRGPGVTDQDIDAIDGESIGPSSRSNIVGFALTGSIEKGDRKWPFEWRSGAAGTVGCGRDVVPFPGVFAFPPESKHVLEVVVHTERLFATKSDWNRLDLAPIVAADKNHDGHLASEELSANRLVAVTQADVFEVWLDGSRITCHAVGYDPTDNVPPPRVSFGDDDGGACDYFATMCDPSTGGKCPAGLRCLPLPDQFDGGTDAGLATEGVCFDIYGFETCGPTQPNGNRCEQGGPCLVPFQRCLRPGEARCLCRPDALGAFCASESTPNAMP